MYAQLVYKVREESNNVKSVVEKDKEQVRSTLRAVLEALKPCFEAPGTNSRGSRNLAFNQLECFRLIHKVEPIKHLISAIFAIIIMVLLVWFGLMTCWYCRLMQGGVGSLLALLETQNDYVGDDDCEENQVKCCKQEADS